ncbi:hypothetical protein [Frigoriglobus tundricola]|uniref:Uncharacterized protein n=1 Tax=Frigoriglobus tundricola TaxID=2774151 RepID=A0A6M5Z231_9BACT|nr:hypothetical protein [Frigoriglobus tundricola]QJW99222.1 hypothetical protein FTUN_6824 [Frigoriglobus tundricola]
MTALLLMVLTAPAADASPAAPVTRLTVAPAAVAKPALKYQLLPEVNELKPGNPVQWYLRCFMEQRNFFFHKDSVAQRAQYQTMPLKELPAEELRNYGGSALTQADWAARLDTPDWQALDRVLTEGADLRTPELGPLKLLAAGLQVRFRGEVARGDFDDAIRTAKTMFAFARHLGEYPTSAANRLGLAVADMALDALTELVEQPGSPNLYWALTDLPVPLVELRKGVQGDRTLADTELRALRADVALSDADLDELLGRLSGRIGFARERAGKPPRNLRGVITARAKDAGAVAAARTRLIDAGAGKNAVAGLPPLQAILLDDKRAFEIRRDDEIKLLGLKLWEIDAPVVGNKDELNGLFEDLLPRVGDSRRAQGRLEQRIALLRHVEALRLYAAAHGGKLPEKPADVGVPLPVDPFTGKPIEYALDHGAATLAARGARYEIALTKPGTEPPAGPSGAQTLPAPKKG